MREDYKNAEKFEPKLSTPIPHSKHFQLKIYQSPTNESQKNPEIYLFSAPVPERSDQIRDVLEESLSPKAFRIWQRRGPKFDHVTNLLGCKPKRHCNSQRRRSQVSEFHIFRNLVSPASRLRELPKGETNIFIMYANYCIFFT